MYYFHSWPLINCRDDDDDDDDDEKIHSFIHSFTHPLICYYVIHSSTSTIRPDRLQRQISDQSDAGGPQCTPPKPQHDHNGHAAGKHAGHAQDDRRQVERERPTVYGGERLAN